MSTSPRYYVHLAEMLCPPRRDTMSAAISAISRRALGRGVKATHTKVMRPRAAAERRRSRPGWDAAVSLR